MKSLRTTLLSIAAIGAFAIAAPALAKDMKEQGAYGASASFSDDIIVVAPGVYRDDTGRRTSSGIPIQELTLQRVINTGDLDLRRDSDVAELHRRVRDTAQSACDEVERASEGAPITTERECVRKATRDAMAQAETLVYARRGYARG